MLKLKHHVRKRSYIYYKIIPKFLLQQHSTVQPKVFHSLLLVFSKYILSTKYSTLQNKYSAKLEIMIIN